MEVVSAGGGLESRDRERRRGGGSDERASVGPGVVVAKVAVELVVGVGRGVREGVKERDDGRDGLAGDDRAREGGGAEGGVSGGGVDGDLAGAVVEGLGVSEGGGDGVQAVFTLVL